MFEVKQSTNDKEIARFTVDGGSGSVQGKGYIGLSAFVDTVYPHVWIGVEEDTIASYLGDLIFGTRGSGSDSAPVERLRITSSGKVGIGTTSPQAPFVVSNSGAQGIEMGYSGGTSSNYIQAYNRSSSAFIQLDVIGNPLVFKAGASAAEAMRIDTSGRLLVGGTASVQVLDDTTAFNSPLQVQGTDASLTIARTIGTANLFLTRNQTVSNNSPLGTISFNGGDGTYLHQGAEIVAEIDGTPGADDMPGRLVFKTTADGASTPTERMRINSGGDVNITGICTATSFSGDGSALTGVESWNQQDTWLYGGG